MTKIRKEQLTDDVTLYCGDSREVIAGLTINRGTDVVSDPPYGIETLVGGYGRKEAGGNQTIANDKNLKVVGEVLALLRGKIKVGWLAAFYSCRITPDFFDMAKRAGWTDYFGEVVWDKKAPGLGTQIRYCHENVAFFRAGKPEQLADCMSLFQFIALKGETRSEGSGHPHEKPDKVMDNIVSTVPGRVIIDPFMGTGSTGAAAVRAKRGFVGIELEPKYFEVALRKIGAAIKQPVAFWE